MKKLIKKNTQLKNFVQKIKNYMVRLNQQKFQNLFQEYEKIDIKPSMIQPVKEIKSLANYKVKFLYTLKLMLK